MYARRLVELTIALLVAGGAGSTYAQAVPLGTAFTYQGQLQDGGSPANGSFDLRFILYTADVGGAQVGPIVTRDDVALSNGLLTVQLDFGGGVFSGEARFLEIAVRPGSSSGADPYTLLSPRQPLTGAPYALYATAAGSVPWTGLTG